LSAVKQKMNADTARFAASEARDTQDSRRAKVAPLLAAVLSIRAISVETGIPIGAVHRAKRQLQKILAQQAEQKNAAISFEAICVMKQNINGVRHDVRRLTVSVFEQAVERAIGRGLLGRGDRAEPFQPDARGQRLVALGLREV
jgi:hypothetical protein